MSATHHPPHAWQRHLPVLGAVVALLLLPVAVVGRGGQAAVASIATSIVALIALAVLVKQRDRAMPRWVTRGGLFLALVLIWLLAYAVSLGSTALR